MKSLTGEWTHVDFPGPSEEACKPFAAQIEAANKKAELAADGKLHHTKYLEIMKQCNRMADVPGIDWSAVAAFRGVTVSIRDCADASAALAAEGSR
jgi:hypothetical protein